MMCMFITQVAWHAGSRVSHLAEMQRFWMKDAHVSIYESPQGHIIDNTHHKFTGSDGSVVFVFLCLCLSSYGCSFGVHHIFVPACMVHGLVYGLLWTISCQWVISCIYREKLRSKYGLPAEPCCDCLVHFCCEPCALCQEHAELRSRGFDASKGLVTRRLNFLHYIYI